MKSKYLLPLLPVLTTLLSGCGQTEIKLNENASNSMAGAQLTATPLELIVYPNDRPSIPDGEPVFQQNCASCHSGAGGGAPAANPHVSNGTADPGAAQAAEGQKSNFKFDAQWAHSTKPLDIYRTIAFGGSNPVRGQRSHPPFSKKLTVTDLWNCVVYTRSLGQPALTTKEIDDINAVFGSNCAVCHGTKGDGDGPLARNLDPMPANFQRFDRFFNRTDDVLFDHIANGIRWEGMPNFLGKKDSAKNVTFDEAYIRKLVQYVHKFQINHEPVLTANANVKTQNSTTTTGTGAETGAPAGNNAQGDGAKKPTGAQ